MIMIVWKSNMLILERRRLSIRFGTLSFFRIRQNEIDGKLLQLIVNQLKPIS